MGRVVRQSPAAWIGLFIVFFVLYAQERKKVLTLPPAEVSPQAALPQVSAQPSQRLMDLSRRLQGDSLFAVQADGLRVDYRLREIAVQFYGEEVYSEGDFAVRESWYTAIDRFAEILKSEMDRGLKIEIVGYTDASVAAEKKPTDFGDSDYALSFARAEWLARFFERRALIPIRERVRLSGAGANKLGRQVEVRLSFE
jgi:flagellar motor protein MotB